MFNSKNFIIILFFINLLYCSAEQISWYKVELTAPENRLEALTRYSIYSADEVRKVFDIKSRGININITLTDALNKNTLSFNNIILPEDVPLEEYIFYLSKSLLLRNTISSRKRNDILPRDIDWLAAAITYAAIWSERDNLSFNLPDYEAARELFRNGQKPDIQKLTSNPIYPDEGPSFKLYAMHCNLLLNLFNREGRDLCDELLVYQGRGSEAYQAMELLLQQKKNSTISLQSWYNSNVEDYARKGRRTSKVNAIKERLEELESVNIVQPGLSGIKSSKIKIDELPNKLKMYRPDKNAATAIYSQFFELTKDAPIFLQEPLLMYLEAFKELQDKKYRSFKKKVKKAREEFYKGIEKEKKLQQLLDKYESENSTLNQEFDLFYDIIHRRQERRTNTQKEITEKLKEYEK